MPGQTLLHKKKVKFRSLSTQSIRLLVVVFMRGENTMDHCSLSSFVNHYVVEAEDDEIAEFKKELHLGGFSHHSSLKLDKLKAKDAVSKEDSMDRSTSSKRDPPGVKVEDIIVEEPGEDQSDEENAARQLDMQRPQSDHLSVASRRPLESSNKPGYESKSEHYSVLSMESSEKKKYIRNVVVSEMKKGNAQNILGKSWHKIFGEQSSSDGTTNASTGDESSNHSFASDQVVEEVKPIKHRVNSPRHTPRSPQGRPKIRMERGTPARSKSPSRRRQRTQALEQKEAKISARMEGTDITRPNSPSRRHHRTADFTEGALGKRASPRRNRPSKSPMRCRSAGRDGSIRRSVELSPASDNFQRKVRTVHGQTVSPRGSKRPVRPQRPTAASDLMLSNHSKRSSRKPNLVVDNARRQRTKVSSNQQTKRRGCESPVRSRPEEIMKDQMLHYSAGPHTPRTKIKLDSTFSRTSDANSSQSSSQVEVLPYRSTTSSQAHHEFILSFLSPRYKLNPDATPGRSNSVEKQRLEAPVLNGTKLTEHTMASPKQGRGRKFAGPPSFRDLFLDPLDEGSSDGPSTNKVENSPRLSPREITVSPKSLNLQNVKSRQPRRSDTSVNSVSSRRKTKGDHLGESSQHTRSSHARNEVKVKVCSSDAAEEALCEKIERRASEKAYSGLHRDSDLSQMYARNGKVLSQNAQVNNEKKTTRRYLSPLRGIFRSESTGRAAPENRSSDEPRRFASPLRGVFRSLSTGREEPSSRQVEQRAGDEPRKFTSPLRGVLRSLSTGREATPSREVEQRGVHRTGSSFLRSISPLRRQNYGSMADSVSRAIPRI